MYLVAVLFLSGVTNVPGATYPDAVFTCITSTTAITAPVTIGIQLLLLYLSLPCWSSSAAASTMVVVVAVLLLLLMFLLLLIVGVVFFLDLM